MIISNFVYVNPRMGFNSIVNMNTGADYPSIEGGELTIDKKNGVATNIGAIFVITNLPLRENDLLELIVHELMEHDLYHALMSIVDEESLPSTLCHNSTQYCHTTKINVKNMKKFMLSEWDKGIYKGFHNSVKKACTAKVGSILKYKPYHDDRNFKLTE